MRQHIGHIIGRHPVTVDGQHAHILALQTLAEDQTADTAETIDTNIHRHDNLASIILFLMVCSRTY